MKSCLVLLTSNFPFGTGEDFITNEIYYYKEHFDKVIVLPIELDPNTPRTRELPDTAETVNVSVKKQRVSRTQDLALGVKNLIVPTELYKYDKEKIGSSLAKRIFFEYFCNRSQRSFKDCLRALEGFNMRQYDSITVYSYWFFATALVGVELRDWFSSFCKDVRLVSRGHGYDIYEDRNTFGYLPLREYLLASYDAVFPCSNFGTEYLSSRYPQFAGKIKTAYLGTRDNGISQPSERGIHILSCSRMCDAKRVSVIVDILECLEKLGDFEIKWTHLGEGNRKEEIKEAVAKRLHNTSAEFPGRIPNDKVYEYYKNNSVDLFLCTSVSEGLPVSMMEAASFGVPIISTNVGGIGEIVRDGFNGKLFSLDAPAEDFAEAIRDFCTADKSEIADYRKNSRQLWEKSFNAEKNYAKFLGADEALNV